jgi:hypothetical protein
MQIKTHQPQNHYALNNFVSVCMVYTIYQHMVTSLIGSKVLMLQRVGSKLCLHS